MTRTALIWWIVFAAALAVGEGLGLLLRIQGLYTFGMTVAWVARLFGAAWVFYGLFRWRETPVIRKTALVIAGSLTAAIIALAMQGLGSTGGLIATIGIYAMALLFFLGIQALRLALSFGHPIFGVARTLVDEAVRMKVPLVFIVALLLFVPALPFSLDASDFLKYRIQTFLTWSMMATGGLLSLMTIFLAVGTVTNELGRRQIFLTMTKPVGRLQYLLGKWLGIVSLNLLLVAICGGAIYVLTLMLAQQPAVDATDRHAVDNQVLVARVATSPSPPSEMNFSEVFRQRVAELRQMDPVRYGNPGDPLSSLPEPIQNEIRNRIVGQWFSIGPRQSRSYMFENVRPAGQEFVQLRLQPKLAEPTPTGEVQLAISAGRGGEAVFKLSDQGFQVLQVPADAVDEQGNLVITVRNPVLPGDIEQPTVSFNPQDGMEILWRAGAFTPNLVRSLVILWLRLSFLAMLGIAMGSALSFPVACLAVLLIYFVAATSGYVAESLEYYVALPGEDASAWEQLTGVPALMVQSIGEGEPGKAVRMVIRVVGEGVMLLVPSFGQYNPTPELADGRLVPSEMLGGAALWIGVVWTSLAGGLAYLLFRRRELARVIV